MTLLSDSRVESQIAFDSPSVQNGVVAARRSVSLLSQLRFETITNQLEPALHESTHFSRGKELGAAVLSYYRLKDLPNVPPTDMISELIPSSVLPMEVRLGRLAFFGNKLSRLHGASSTTLVSAKLAVELISDDLEEEARSYEKEYANLGITLNSYPGDGEYHPHISLANIAANVFYFTNTDSLRSLMMISGLDGSSDKTITLDPIRRSSSYPTS